MKIAAKNYDKKDKKYFLTRKLSFDIVLLGMGDDGHIASIFPGEIDKNKINYKSCKKKRF